MCFWEYISTAVSCLSVLKNYMLFFFREKFEWSDTEKVLFLLNEVLNINEKSLLYVL